MSLPRRLYLIPVLAPAGEILFFVRKATCMWRMQKMQEQFSAKEKYPKEIRPMQLTSCAPSVLSGFAGRDSCPSSKVRHSCRTLYALWVLRAIPDKAASARRGITGMGALLGWIRHEKIPYINTTYGLPIFNNYELLNSSSLFLKLFALS